MYAIVDIAGEQCEVEKDQKLRVPLLDAQEGDELTFNDVLLFHGDSDIKIGAPTIQGAYVKAQVVKHGKDKKVIIFKKRRRKGSKVKNGHRQKFTEIEIKDIVI